MKRIALLFVVLVTSQALADAPEPLRIHWQNTPIPVALSIGNERRVAFQAPVSVGVPSPLKQVLRTQTVNGHVYFRASAPFASTRVLVRELESGQTYLLDVEASEEEEEYADLLVVNGSPEAWQPGRRQASIPSHSTVSLTRFAAQQLFAPLRLATPLAGVARVPVQSSPVLLVPSDAIEAMPLIAWQAGSLYVTAVKLKNVSDEPQDLDPRVLRGHWLSATFQHTRLLPAGRAADTTAVYLISVQPFAESF